MKPTAIRSGSLVVVSFFLLQGWFGPVCADDLIQNNFGWDDQMDTISQNSWIPVQASINMSSPPSLEEDLTLDGNAGVKLQTLCSRHGNLRVLHLLTHGMEDGWIMFDAFDNEPDAQATYSNLIAGGFFDTTEIAVSQASVGNKHPYCVHLRPAGISNKLQQGHFVDEGLVLGWYSYSGVNPQWLGGEVQTLLGKSNEVHHGEHLKWFYKAAGCDSVQNINDTLTVDGTIGSALRFAKFAGAKQNKPVTNLSVYGDGSNSLLDPALRKWANACLVAPPWVDLDFFGVNEGEAGWKVNEETNTYAYRVSYSETRRSNSWRVISSPIRAHGGPGTYTCIVPSFSGGWYKLEAAHMTLDGEAWESVGYARGGAIDQGPQLKIRSFRGGGGEGFLRAGSKDRTPGGKGSCGPDVDFEGTGKLTRSQGSNGGVLIVLPCGITSLPRETAQRIAETYAAGLAEYGDFDSDSIVVFESQECYHGGDSLQTANRIIDGDERYVLLFGHAGRMNQYGPVTRVLPWILDRSFEEVWLDSVALSVADWEGFTQNGTITKSIGFLPVRDSTDMWNYYDKMVDYYTHGPDGYEHSLGLWGYDSSFWGSLYHDGGVVRSEVRNSIDRVHPSWNVRKLLYTEMPWPNYEPYLDSTSAALIEGRANVVGFSTASSYLIPCRAIESSNDDLFNALANTGSYTHFLLLSCSSNKLDVVDESYGMPAIERLLQVPGGGAISSIGPTRGYYQWYYFEYWERYAEILNAASGPIRVGDLHRMAREAILEEDSTEVARMFCRITMLLGDPTIPVYGMFAEPISDVSPPIPPNERELLGRPRPSPFNPETIVSMSLPVRENVHLYVYDASGRVVRTLIEGDLDAGFHEVKWDGRTEGGRNASSGVYFIRLQAGDSIETRRTVLIR